MIRPDMSLICENVLLNEGFLQARILSVKVVTLHDKSLELLNKQVCCGCVWIWVMVYA